MYINAQNTIEAKTISLHFIAYCLHNINDKKKARELFQEVNDFCQEKNYKWFRLLNLDWLMGSQEASIHHSFTEIETIYEKALLESEKIKDTFTTQKLLLSLLRQSSFLKKEQQTFNNLHKLFWFLKQPNVSIRQRLRIFDKSIPILSENGFHSFSKEAVLESVALAKPNSDSSFFVSCQINTGIVYLQSGDLEKSKEWFNKALEHTLLLREKNLKQTNLTKIFLQKGHLETKNNNLEKAVEYYDKALDIVKNLNLPDLFYEVQKSRLTTYQSLGNDKQIEKDIYSVLQMVEKYRKNILDEDGRNSFFDNEQKIFDLAIEHKLRLNQNEIAYYYSEISNSRSLLDWLLKGGKVLENNQKAKILLNISEEPLQIQEIRKNMPAKVQLLQYTVLNDKILIWVISKEKFVLAVSNLSSAELFKEVENYLTLIKNRKLTEEISAKLYNLLVLPALPYLDKNNSICIIPDKVLFQLPFSSLKSPSGSYFLEEFDLFYSTSANVFIYSTQKAESLSKIKNERLLSIGNPFFDHQRFPNLEDLSEAEIEVNTISENYYKPLNLTGKEATKEAFQKNYQNFEVLHFAGHYLVQPDYPLFSKLILASDDKDETNDFITNADILSKKLPKTKLVVLAACQTGVEKYSDGEGLIGLSRTFLAMGVPIIVASQWQVDSDSTTKLMKKFHYLRRVKQLSSIRALRQSQLELLKIESENYENPYFWAGFAIYGGFSEY